MMVSRGFVLCFESTKARRNRKEIKKYVKKNGNSWEIILSTILLLFFLVYTRVPVDENKNRFGKKKNIYYLICAVISTLIIIGYDHQHVQTQSGKKLDMFVLYFLIFLFYCFILSGCLTPESIEYIEEIIIC